MRETFQARLQTRLLLSEAEQCHHLTFTVDELNHFSFVPGQFISCVAEDSRGKQQTRAYSLASAPRGSQFDLCVNRVEGGFFSNRLCDLEVGASIDFHGPHGLFTLQEAPVDSIWFAVETGIAPFRSFAQALFRSGSATPADRDVWLIFGAQRQSGLFYHHEFEQLAAANSQFHYFPTVDSPEESWPGLQGAAQDHLQPVIERRAELLQQPPGPTAAGAAFDLYAYLCGLGAPVTAARERLKTLGWQRKQIVSERYD